MDNVRDQRPTRGNTSRKHSSGGVRPRRRTSKAHRIATTVICTAAFIFIPAVPSASAATCDTPGNFFDGFGHDADAHDDQFIGASGYITNRYASTCSSDTSGPDPSVNRIGSNFTTSWVMIAANDSKSWSQVGVIAGFNELDYVWAEVYRSTPYERYDRFVSNSPIAAGTTNAYYEKYNANCPAPTNGPCEQSLVNSTRVTDTNFNPFSYFVYHRDNDTGVKWRPNYFGEKTYQENDIMGNSASRTNFRQIGVQRINTSSFVLEPCTLSAFPTSDPKHADRAGLVANGCYNFDIWATS